MNKNEKPIQPMLLFYTKTNNRTFKAVILINLIGWSIQSLMIQYFVFHVEIFF